MPSLPWRFTNELADVPEPPLSTDRAVHRPLSRFLGRPWVGALLTFVLTFGSAAPLLVAAPVILDTDSYFHLAIARLYQERGVVDGLPWARFSAMAEGFGDKEVLFHALLAPFADGFSTLGGRVALALLVAAASAAMAAIAVRLAGPWGLLAPWIVLLGAQTYLLRVVRLRPELLALTLFLLAAGLVGQRRYRLLGLVGFAFALGYTAFHAFLGLCGLWFLFRGVWRQRWDWQLVLYPIIGVGLALVVHPHFPHNLVIWKIQSIDFFRLKGMLDVGGEIGPPSTDVMLIRNLGLWIALGALVLARGARRGGDTETTAGTSSQATRTQATRDALGVAAAVFGLLYLLMARFAIYAAPFALLWALAWAGRLHGGLDRLRLPLPRLGFGSSEDPPGEGRSWGPASLSLTVILVLTLTASTLAAVPFLRTRLFAKGPVDRETEWAAFGRSVPPGARVAAEWGSGQLYLFWAPQALYLNVLDPIFMAVPFPEAHTAHRAVVTGDEPDVPWVLHTQLDSDHLAAPLLAMSERLLARTLADPRIESRFGGLTRLYAMTPDRNGDFVLDWRVVPPGVALPVAADAQISSWPAYPRASSELGRRLEGFVDAARLPAPARCQAFVQQLAVAQPIRPVFELAPWGPTRLWLDDRLLVSQFGESAAILGRGPRVVLDLAPGAHQLTVETCAVDARARQGFYLLARARG